MDASVTVAMNAPAEQIWELVADVRNTGKFSPEVMKLNGSTAQRVPRWARRSAGT
jgi:ribosome-associated toxin RatA of RatAB toxin-antitoxin module